MAVASPGAFLATRIPESLKDKSPLSPTCAQSPPWQLDQGTGCHVQTFLGHLQGWGVHYLPGHPFSMPDHPFSEEIPPERSKVLGQGPWANTRRNKTTQLSAGTREQHKGRPFWSCFPTEMFFQLPFTALQETFILNNNRSDSRRDVTTLRGGSRVSAPALLLGQECRLLHESWRAGGISC